MPKPLSKSKVAARNPSSSAASQSLRSVRPTSSSGISKRDKRDAKKGNWHDRLKTVYANQAIVAEKQKRVEKLGVAADLESIKLALGEAGELGLEDSSLNEDEDAMEEDGSSARRVKIKQAVEQPKRSKPVKQTSRIKANIGEMSRFQKILQHGKFKDSPLATIQTHLKNTL
ncbi:hypothetical protein HDU67_003199 [Dinochytrium kinnereticum]|nr:hypothetical protein HDU67_003199 [Dinochytrium kinnereticum]